MIGHLQDSSCLVVQKQANQLYDFLSCWKIEPFSRTNRAGIRWRHRVRRIRLRAASDKSPRGIVNSRIVGITAVWITASVPWLVPGTNLANMSTWVKLALHLRWHLRNMSRCHERSNPVCIHSLSQCQCNLRHSGRCKNSYALVRHLRLFWGRRRYVLPIACAVGTVIAPYYSNKRTGLPGTVGPGRRCWCPDFEAGNRSFV